MATALLSLSRCAKKADKGLSGMWELMQRPLTHTHTPAVDRIATTHAARPPQAHAKAADTAAAAAGLWHPRGCESTEGNLDVFLDELWF